MISPSRIGAFFDLDGTLLAAPSLEWRFARHLFARGKIGPTQFRQWATHCTKKTWRNPSAELHANKYHLAGLHESSATDWENSLQYASAKIRCRPIFAEGIERITWHTEQGHRIFFVTGTIEPLAHVFARLLARSGLACSSEIRATGLETSGGIWTGRITGDHMSGVAKAAAVSEFAARHNLSLAESYAYGNAHSDLAMLEAVGHPVAVNPQTRLARTAQRRGWAVCDWQSLDQTTSRPGSIVGPPGVTSAGKPRELAAEESR